MEASFRDRLIATLLRSNVRRVAWPVHSVIILMRHLNAPKMAYEEFVALTASLNLESAVREELKKLTRARFEGYLSHA